MNIGFEAKRAFHNHTGLGNYSRQVIQDLHHYYPNNEFFLYTPKFNKNENPLFRLFRDHPNTKCRVPEGFSGVISADLWRRNLGKYAKKDHLDLFLGLANELPSGFGKATCKKVVVIHDVIFKRYPQWYKPLDRKICDMKVTSACKHADGIIAISQQTKDDLVRYYKVAEEKITVIHQSCHERFYDNENIPFRNEIIQKYKLDKPFFLMVGTLNERKNAIRTVEAFNSIKDETDHDLIIVGNGPLKGKIEDLIEQYNLHGRVHLYTNFPSNDLPPLYQLATLSIYPSTYEGFGIPLIESLWSKTPVLATAGHCFEETAGPGAVFLQDHSMECLAKHMLKLSTDNKLLDDLAAKGFSYVQQYHKSKTTKNLFDYFEKIVAS